MIEPQQKVDLQPYNTLSVPAESEFFFSATSISDIQNALAWAHQKQLDVTVLSGGSNIVLQGDLTGLCLHIELKGIDFKIVDEQWVDVRVAAGENWHQFVQQCLFHQAHGLENLALIPGYVGAAPVQNIGAYGVEVKDFLLSLKAIRRGDGEVIQFTASECKFSYRDSVFKSDLRDQYVITELCFRLSRQPLVNLSYAALAESLSHIKKPSPQDVFTAVVGIRESKLPNPDQIANVGSFFKNPVVSADQFEQLKNQYPAIVGYPENNSVKLAAGWLIDQAGWKGKELNGVGVHHLQALVITNTGHCKGSQVIALANEIKTDIRAQFGVELEIEPRIY